MFSEANDYDDDDGDDEEEEEEEKEAGGSVVERVARTGAVDRVPCRSAERISSRWLRRWLEGVL